MITSRGSLIAFYDRSILTDLEKAKIAGVSTLHPLLLNRLKGLYWEICGRPDEASFGDKLLGDEDVVKRAFVIDLCIQRHFLPEGFSLVAEMRSLNTRRDLDKTAAAFSESQGPLNRYRASYYDATLASKDPYINANFIFGGRMIISQAPLPTQIGLFWSMAAAHNIQTVVSLWGEDAKDYFEYYPNPGEARWFFEGIGSLVSLSKERWEEGDYECRDAMTVREVAFDDKWHKPHLIQHIQVHTWRDMSCPSRKLMLKILGQLRGKLLIHCTAGIGRSGVLATLAHIKAEIDRGQRPPRVFDVVQSLRDPTQGRCPDVVEEAAQYVFIHSMLKDIALK